jgi:hypothetical protein
MVGCVDSYVDTHVCVCTYTHTHTHTHTRDDNRWRDGNNQEAARSGAATVGECRGCCPADTRKMSSNRASSPARSAAKCTCEPDADTKWQTSEPTNQTPQTQFCRPRPTEAHRDDRRLLWIRRDDRLERNVGITVGQRRKVDLHELPARCAHPPTPRIRHRPRSLARSPHTVHAHDRPINRRHGRVQSHGDC